MPVEAKPIFRPDVVRLPLLGFGLPELVAQWREKLKKWAEIISTGSVDAHKEQEILCDFINDVFCELLGYTRAVDNPNRYTISREKHVQVDGKFADAVLGEFGPEGKRYAAAVEGKGPKNPLDRPFGGRKVSAVDQAFDYAINLRCNWIQVASGMRRMDKLCIRVSVVSNGLVEARFFWFVVGRYAEPKHRRAIGIGFL